MTPSTPRDIASALTAATELLCTEHDPGSVSMRQIAAATGVSLGLAYYYFESREALFGATLTNMARHIDAAASTETTAAGMASKVFDTMRERPAFARIVASMTLSGSDVTEAMGEHPFLARLMRLASEDGSEGITDTGLAVSILLGANLYQPTVNRALNRDDDDSEVHVALRNVVTALLGPSQT